jgi:hypothetical protein
MRVSIDIETVHAKQAFSLVHTKAILPYNLTDPQESFHRANDEHRLECIYIRYRMDRKPDISRNKNRTAKCFYIALQIDSQQ